MNSVTFGTAESLELRNNSDQLLGSKPFTTLYNNAQKGTYVTYKYEDVNLTGANFMFLFSCWGFQIKLENYKSVLQDKVMNVYVSMKIEGNITDAETNPTYYIKSIKITEPANAECEHGTKTEVLPVVVNPVETWTLVLGDNIGVKFALNLQETDIVTVTVNGNEASFDLVDNVLEVHVAAAQMTDEIVIYVNGEALENSYSVRAYADYILAGDYNEATKNLVVAMLAYGHAAQDYFGYNLDNPALGDVDLTGRDPVKVPESVGMMMEGSLNGIEFYGATLVHKEKIALRFYFTGELTEEMLAGYTVGTKNGMTYIEIDGINPQDLGAAVEVVLTDGTDTLTVSYSPLAYISRMHYKEGASNATKVLVAELYQYYLAAQAYVAA